MVVRNIPMDPLTGIDPKLSVHINIRLNTRISES